ncbi:MAG TPA: histidine kinase, partial [Dermatophilaceae bacterium]
MHSSTRPRRRGLRLRTQAVLFQVALLTVVLVIGLAVSILVLRRDLEHQFEQRALAIARSVAQDDRIAKMVLTSRPTADGPAQGAAEKVRRATQALYVVVTDDSGIRYSHPNRSLVGQRVSTDPSEALAGREFVAIQRGTLGDSARGKVPLRAEDGSVVGEVSVGISTVELNARMRELAILLILISAVALAVGVLGAVTLAHRLRRTTLGLEPEEMADLLREHAAVLGGVRDGVIAIDHAGRVTVCNPEAKRLLGGEVRLG